MSADGGGRLVVPSANRGLKGETAIVDYCTLTAAVSAVPATQGRAWVESAFALFLGRTVLSLDRAARGPRNFYGTSWRILTPEGQVCGFIAVGGNAGSWCLDLTGAGCSYVGNWSAFADVADRVGAKLTRVDCAHDDFFGTHPICWARQEYEAGSFVRGGRPPSAQFIDDCGSNEGCTFYVGRNSGNQTLCAYEKGKQLGDRASPWVRYEGRFGNKYREIPTDVLRRPGEFLAGMFPVLHWISELADRFKTAAKRAKASFDSLATHCKRQYGRLLHLARRVHRDEAVSFLAWVETISRSGLPAKLKVPHVGALVSADVWRSELCVS